MRRALTLAATGLLSLTAWGADPPVAPADEDRVPAPQGAIPLPELTVAAPEPRYVAPTLRDRIGRIWAPVLINGQGPFRLVLDTGASRSAVTAKVAGTLGVPIEESDRVTMHGVTGSALASTIHVERLEVGELLVERPQLLVVEDAFGGAEGVLATEGLKDKRITIEFRRDRIEIARSRRQPAPAGFATIPVQLAKARLITSDARVGPLRVKAIIDTGAQQTIGNLALRDRLLALRSRAVDEQEQDVVGMTGDVQSGPNARVPSISLGEMYINRANITFVDLHIFRHWGYVDEPVLMIGMDVLGLLDTLIIDYRRRELQVLTRRRALL